MSEQKYIVRTKVSKKIEFQNNKENNNFKHLPNFNGIQSESKWHLIDCLNIIMNKER